MSTSDKITIHTLRKRKSADEKFAMLTCYDYPTAQLLSAAGIDTILAGDTYAEVCLGHSSTLPATMEMMVTITAAVRRGAPQAFLLGDMPYLSYQASIPEAIHNAGRFMAEAGCDAVKVEVDRRLADLVAALTRATIPVCAHLGLKPQSIHQMGGYIKQGKSAECAQRLIEDARQMEKAGASLLLLEGVPDEVARIITEQSELPVIGIAAGPACDGQVLVLHDILGFQAGHPPKAAKRYTELHPIMVQAFKSFRQEVVGGTFPGPAHSTPMAAEEWLRLKDRLSSSTSG
ncbi:MAG: 3-methyl-2-oxobutanoate hydroxymethyltransferase [Phycisphaerae bacterium]|nr:3-methyl-2-oxobutanoate hydroxymethyltransferase [Phycisphaerae bacterium]